MRAVLGLAVLLLGIALVAEFGVGPWRSGPARGADRALEVLVGARGRMLPSARPGTGREWMDTSVRLGDRTFVAREDLDGFFVVRWDLENDTAEVLEFAADESGSAGALARTIDGVRAPTLLVLATQGALSAFAPADLEPALATLGSAQEIGRLPTESFALIALCGPQGWVLLAQAHSAESGVVAAFVLGADLERYTGFQGDSVEVQEPKETALFLVDQLPWAQAVDPRAVQRTEATLLGRAMPGLRQRAHAPLVWEDVPIGAGSGFLGWLGVDPETPGPLEFQVLVDGDAVVQRTVAPGTPWRTELVDLRAFEGRRVRLELRVEPAGNSAADGAVGLWGRPTLFRGFERSPIAAWAEAR